MLTILQAYIGRYPAKYRLEDYNEDQIIKNMVHAFLKDFLNTAKGNFRKQVSRVTEFSAITADPITPAV